MLRIEDLHVAYGSHTVVSGVEFAVAPKEIVLLIGHNGAGKSSVLKGITGLAKTPRGRVAVDERDITGMPPHRVVKSGVAYVAQGQDLFPQLSVEYNVWMGGYLLSSRQRNRRLKECMELFPVLNDKRKLNAGNLSGGERQQVKLARAMMLEPQYLMLDEPTAGLSPKLADDAMSWFRRLRDELGVGVLLVEQNVRRSITLADTVLVMKLGTIVDTASQEQLEADPDLLQRLLFGTSATMDVEPQVEEHDTSEQ